MSEFDMITCLTNNDVKNKTFKNIKSIYPNVLYQLVLKEDFESLDKILKEYSFLSLFVLMLQMVILSIFQVF